MRAKSSSASVIKPTTDEYYGIYFPFSKNDYTGVSSVFKPVSTAGISVQDYLTLVNAANTACPIFT